MASSGVFNIRVILPYLPYQDEIVQSNMLRLLRDMMVSMKCTKAEHAKDLVLMQALVTVMGRIDADLIEQGLDITTPSPKLPPVRSPTSVEISK